MSYDVSDGISYTLLSTWLTCRMKATYMVQGWERKGFQKSYLFGTIVHAALEHTYRWARKQGTEVDPLDATKEASHAIQTMRKPHLKRASSAEIADFVELCLGKADTVLGHYFYTYPQDLMPKTWHSVEGAFDTSWMGFKCVGKIDGIKKIKKRKHKLKLFETKTRSRISEDTLSDQLDFDLQSLWYLCHAERILGKPYSINSAEYNIIRNPQTHRNKGQDIPAYLEKVDAEIEKKPNHYFKRYAVEYPEEVKTIFKRELHWKLIEFANWVEGKIPNYKNETACVGQYSCEYLKACASGTMIGFAQTHELFNEITQEESIGGKANPKKTKKVEKTKRKKVRKVRKVKKRVGLPRVAV